MRLQFLSMNVSRLLLISSSLVFLLLMLPPFLSFEWRYVVMEAFSAVCHQMPERSFHIAETSLAVCHRCTGIYAGIPMAMATAFMIDLKDVFGKKTWGLVLFASLGIMGLDWGLSVVGLYENTLHSRVATGLLFGMAAGAYLAIVVRPGRELSSVEIPRDNFV